VIVDASVVIDVVTDPGPRGVAARAALASIPATEPLLAPGHLAVEVMSGLGAAANRPSHPLEPGDVAGVLADAEALEIDIEATPLDRRAPCLGPRPRITPLRGRPVRRRRGAPPNRTPDRRRATRTFGGPDGLPGPHRLSQHRLGCWCAPVRVGPQRRTSATAVPPADELAGGTRRTTTQATLSPLGPTSWRRGGRLPQRATGCGVRCHRVLAMNRRAHRGDEPGRSAAPGSDRCARRSARRRAASLTDANSRWSCARRYASSAS